MNGLILHCGAHAATRDDVAAVPTPAPDGVWHPIPHLTVRDLVAENVATLGLRIVEEAFGLWKAGARAFGLLGLRNGDQAPDYELVLGWRNSHDKSFPAAGALGSRVFVCDNLAFSGEVTFARKHTTNVIRDLPGLVSRAVARLVGMRRTMDERIAAYKAQVLGDVEVHDLLIRSLDRGVVGPVRLRNVLDEWRAPRHDAFRDRTAWSLFNAYTEVLKRVSLPELPTRTVALHGLLDQACGLLVDTATHFGDDVRPSEN